MQRSPSTVFWTDQQFHNRLTNVQEQNKEEIEKELEKFILDYISKSDKLNTLSVSDTVDSDASLEGKPFA